MPQKRPFTLSLKVAVVVATLFGLLTIISGGMALTGNKEVGNAIPFVLGFNFFAGFAYLAAAYGLAKRLDWGLKLSFGIAIATALVFVAFGVVVMQGAAYEIRTVGAMVVRTGIWVVISYVAANAYRQFTQS